MDEENQFGRRTDDEKLTPVRARFILSHYIPELCVPSEAFKYDPETLEGRHVPGDIMTFCRNFRNISKQVALKGRFN